MATCNHCGQKNVTDGKLCPNCFKKVEDNSLAYLAIIILLIVIVAFIIGPALLLYKAYKTRKENRTNWWLMGALITAVTALFLAPHLVEENNHDWQWYSSTVFYFNLIALIGTSLVFFFRLKEREYRFVKLFKKQNNDGPELNGNLNENE